MGDLFAQHMEAEPAGDLETTLATMTDNPHLINVPSLIGGSGRAEAAARLWQAALPGPGNPV
jgi:hypothetical protein